MLPPFRSVCLGLFYRKVFPWVLSFSFRQKILLLHNDFLLFLCGFGKNIGNRRLRLLYYSEIHDSWNRNRFLTAKINFPSRRALSLHLSLSAASFNRCVINRLLDRPTDRLMDSRVDELKKISFRLQPSSGRRVYPFDFRFFRGFSFVLFVVTCFR